MGREFHYRWEWRLRSSPESLWPLVADTNRFDRDAGLPPIQRIAVSSSRNGIPRQRVRLSVLGMTVEWDEEPFEWVRPERFGVVRRYSSGPVQELRVLVTLTPEDEGGTLLTYDIHAVARSLIGQVAIPLQIGVMTRRAFAETFRRYDRLAAGEAASLPARRRPLSSSAAARLKAARDGLTDRGASSALTTRLCALIEAGDDLALSRLRPYALADEWSAQRREVLELCLHATRVGMLEFRWDLLCPLCRGAKDAPRALGEVRSRVHCETCNIDFAVNFDRLVELTFQPNPAIRAVSTEEYCLGGPQVTPHVVIQQMLAPGTTRTLSPALEPGKYRVRTLDLPGGQMLAVEESGDRRIAFRTLPEGWSHDEPRIAPACAITFENATLRDQLFILERMAWSDQAATAADVTALQIFRDLFSSEALRPGEQISVGSLTLLFTDLCESTRLYREIGDAPAFGRVMSHFDVLKATVTANGGAIVKTIGDAVMAVFRSNPLGAVRAVMEAQDALAAPAEGASPLLLKAGLHQGPCIAVTLNDRLDYFGSTVNIAARLAGLATGGEIVLSDPLRNDPEVAALLAASTDALSLSPVEATLRGFDTQPFAFWRLVRKAGRSVGHLLD